MYTDETGQTSCKHPVDCVMTWGKWSACDNTTDKHTRSPVVTQSPVGGGTPCPSPQEKDCPIDCAFTWGPLTGDCAKLNDVQTRSPVINTQSRNGGKACPTRQEHETCCIVDCVYSWNAWSACDQQTSKKIRSAAVTRPASGGGSACPVDEEQTCVPPPLEPAACSTISDPLAFCISNGNKYVKIIVQHC